MKIMTSKKALKLLNELRMKLMASLSCEQYDIYANVFEYIKKKLKNKKSNHSTH